MRVGANCTAVAWCMLKINRAYIFTSTAVTNFKLYGIFSVQNQLSVEYLIYLKNLILAKIYNDPIVYLKGLEKPPSVLKGAIAPIKTNPRIV